MHQNTFGGRALPRTPGGLVIPLTPYPQWGPKGEVPISKGDGREGKRVTPKVQLSSIKH